MHYINYTTSKSISLPKQIPNICFHCGEECQDVKVLLQDKSFCCQGCKMVYEILNENDLCQYYNLENKPGVSLKGKKTPQFAWLDDEVIQSQLIDFQEDRVVKVSFYLPAIHCASCIWLLENLFKFNESILNSKVNFIRKEIKLTFDTSKISLRQIAELLSSIGYEPEINLGDVGNVQRKKVDKKLIYQLGVAGFAFGNIMLLSFPEYLGLSETDAEGFQKWFGGLNILLALPVVFFSGKDYLRSAWWSIRQGSVNIDVPITMGIMTLFLRSVFEIVVGYGAGYLDSLAGLVFFLLIGKWFQQITFNHLSFERDYKSYFPVAALLQNGETTPIQNLKPQDIIIVKNKELIPADGILLKGKASIDYSFVTGESEPISKKSGDKIYAGGKQIGEALRIQVTRTVAQSYLTQLWNDAAFSKTDSTSKNSQTLADKVGKYFTYAILSIAFLTLNYWLPIDAGKAINAFTSVLIIACPCAVALSIPFTFGNAIRILGRNGFYLKNTTIIERLQSISAIVFDKTGTLTEPFCNNEITFVGEPLRDEEKSWIEDLVQVSSHPLSKAIYSYVINPIYSSSQLLVNPKEVEGKGLQGTVNQQVIQLGSAEFTNNPPNENANVFLNINGKMRGFFSVKNQYRKGIQPVIDFFKNKNSIHLLSGDNEKTRQDLEPIFGQNLHYQQSPKDKLGFIKKLQAQHEKVMMFGDGLNDAGALQQSNVGIVISENTNNFTPASDAILDAQLFSKIPQFLKFIQGCYRLVFAAYGLAVIYNMIGLSYAVQAKLSPVIAAILMPASSVSIVLFGVLTSTYLAWRYGIGDENHS